MTTILVDSDQTLYTDSKMNYGDESAFGRKIYRVQDAYIIDADGTHVAVKAITFTGRFYNILKLKHTLITGNLVEWFDNNLYDDFNILNLTVVIQLEKCLYDDKGLLEVIHLNHNNKGGWGVAYDVIPKGDTVTFGSGRDLCASLHELLPDLSPLESLLLHNHLGMDEYSGGNVYFTRTDMSEIAIVPLSEVTDELKEKAKQAFLATLKIPE